MAKSARMKSSSHPAFVTSYDLSSKNATNVLATDKNVRILANSCCDDGKREVVCEHDVREDEEVHVTPVIGHQDNRMLLKGLLEL